MRVGGYCACDVVCFKDYAPKVLIALYSCMQSLSVSVAERQKRENDDELLHRRAERLLSLQTRRRRSLTKEESERSAIYKLTRKKRE